MLGPGSVLSRRRTNILITARPSVIRPVCTVKPVRGIRTFQGLQKPKDNFWP